MSTDKAQPVDVTKSHGPYRFPFFHTTIFAMLVFLLAVMGGIQSSSSTPLHHDPQPTVQPTYIPSATPTKSPTKAPTKVPTTAAPTPT
jgi:hypothetical protein